MSKNRPVVPKPEETLTPRQIQTAALVAQGMSNKDIASICGISVDTVKRHVQDAMAKTGRENRTALALWFNARYPSSKEARAAYQKAVLSASEKRFPPFAYTAPAVAIGQ